MSEHDGLAQEVHHFIQEYATRVPQYHLRRIEAALIDETVKDCPEPERQPRPEPFKVFGRPWQDLVFATGEVVFLVALIPLLFTNSHVPAYTGFSTGAMLALFGVCQASYRNWITLALTLITALVWVLLGFGVSF